MQLLEERIRKDGIIKEGNVLKVDRFLNHQMDIELFDEMGKEFKRLFADKPINKILTIEASGIGIACVVARHFHPVSALPASRRSILMFLSFLRRKIRPKILPETFSPHRWNPTPTAESMTSSYPKNSFLPTTESC